MYNSEEIKETIQNNPFTIIEFGTSDCGTCAAISYKLGKWVKEHAMVKYFYLPLNAYKSLAASYQIFSAPTVLCFTEGHLINQSSGYFSVEEIFRIMERNIALWQEREAQSGKM